ncbi:MAG: dUTP diphosphatase [Propionibacteriaceae bacterium]|nr:dUTP diphosphatase [Propionibacteriaceae bacterium]
MFLSPGERVVVGTGIALAIPPGWVGLIHPRSGLAARSGLTIVNSPGTIDSGYRGEIKVCLLNTDPKMPIELKRGDKIAQLLLQRVAQAALYEVEHFDETERGEQGYGSSGGIQSWGTGGK